MTPGLMLYKVASSCLGLVSGLVLRRRVRAGKEDPARLDERRAINLPACPEGIRVWLHGASVGESLMLLELGKRLLAKHSGMQLLLTSQTQTSARLIAARLPERARHQMAPLDTPATARRFIASWQPDLVLIAEGEIWPNLLQEAKRSGAKLALINARMTEKSLSGWGRWPATAQTLFGAFDLILAADKATASGLERLSSRPVQTPGNLTTALQPAEADETSIAEVKSAFIGTRHTLVGASTHPGEEALLLDAAGLIDPAPALILAPRHPERGDSIEAEIRARGFSVVRRSRGDRMEQSTDILLADTLGEMGVWYRLADTIYLGGAHMDGIGGHNPIEALKLGKPVITGPYVHNFADMVAQLTEPGAVQIVADAAAIAASVTASQPLPQTVLEAITRAADAPMLTTLARLERLLPAQETG